MFEISSPKTQKVVEGLLKEKCGIGSVERLLFLRKFCRSPGTRSSSTPEGD